MLTALITALGRARLERLADAVISRVKRGDAKAAEIFLDGLYASKTRENEVNLLNRLATTVPSPLKPRARKYLADKELRLTDQSIRELFETSGEHFRIKESLGPGLLTNAYLAIDTAESGGDQEVEVVLQILKSGTFVMRRYAINSSAEAAR